jgi:glycosyltransferase involved in cell wall biosynthesis
LVASILLIVFLVSLLVQLCFYLGVFKGLAFYKEPPIATAKAPVSVVVCVHGELANLKKLLPALASQQYAIFEIIIVNDRSGAEVESYLEEQKQKTPNLTVLHINNTPSHINPKKWALTQGIMAAKYELILLTDADCLPASDRWISLIASHFKPETQIVLGYAPYQQKATFLNTLVRYETFFAGIQFLSLCIAGRPYMGIGRNLAYRKSLFLQHNGFQKHMSITGGDDDLFVNSTATKQNVAICINEQAQTVSLPKTTFKSWYKQKRRHLSVSKHYRFMDKVILGSLSMSHFLFWCCFAVLLALQEYQWIAWLGLCGKILAQVFIFNKISRNIGEKFNWITYPLLDFLYIFYYLIFGIPALLSKRIRWN